MLVALLALFIALGGTGYAALKLPKNSVGSKQIKSNAVTSPKVKAGSLLASDFNASERTSLRGPEGPRGLEGVAGAPATKLWAVPSDDCTSLLRGSGAVSLQVGGAANSRCDVRFNRDVSSCVPQATLQPTPALTSGGEVLAQAGSDAGLAFVDADEIATLTYVSDGTPARLGFYLAVYC
jgi:hypothetical protein